MTDRDGLVDQDRDGGDWSPQERRLALVVDDEPIIGCMFGAMLRRHGWKTIVTTNPERAIALAEQRAIDLLVTDYDMPGMTGLELAARLRAHDSNLPVLVASVWPTAVSLIGTPPTSFVSKPVGMVEFITHVRALLG